MDGTMTEGRGGLKPVHPHDMSVLSFVTHPMNTLFIFRRSSFHAAQFLPVIVLPCPHDLRQSPESDGNYSHSAPYGACPGHVITIW